MWVVFNADDYINESGEGSESIHVLRKSTPFPTTPPNNNNNKTERRALKKDMSTGESRHQSFF